MSLTFPKLEGEQDWLFAVLALFLMSLLIRLYFLTEITSTRDVQKRVITDTKTIHHLFMKL